MPSVRVARNGASSIGSPSTLKSRPRISGPTGTEMGPPVSKTSVPRASPSVESSAMVRAMPSPRSCTTSRGRPPTASPARSRSLIAGNLPLNPTSTTGPMTWVTAPGAFASTRAR
jgi:hypothetical protein